MPRCSHSCIGIVITIEPESIPRLIDIINKVQYEGVRVTHLRNIAVMKVQTIENVLRQQQDLSTNQPVEYKKVNSLFETE